MNRFGRLLTELKGTIAERTWDTCALILLWLHLRRLTSVLDALFTAWRAGTLPVPPQPAPAQAEPAPAVPPTRAPRPYSARPRQRRTPRASNALQARPAPTQSTPPQPHHPPQPLRQPNPAPRATFRPVQKMRQIGAHADSRSNCSV